MTQPRFVPITESDQVRPALQLHVPEAWLPDRPAEQAVPRRTEGRRRGTPGPDQGYALRLARRFEDRLVLGPGESAEDALVGAALLAATRSALFGRAPVIYDVEFALELWGFLSPADAELVAARRLVFGGVSHHYTAQRDLIDQVPADTLRLDAGALAGRQADWRQLTGVGTGPH
jgi:hypothetical protein